jgi:sodium/hydrogen exchanger family protein
MLDLLTFILAAVAVIVVLQFLADKTGLPAAALLTVAGLVYGVLPGPNPTLEPHVILTFVIPPLIYSAALNSSLLAIRKNLRAVISLSIGLVLATAVVVGIGSVQAGLSRLAQIAADDRIPGSTLASLRASLDFRARRYRQLLDRLEASEDATPATSPEYEAALHARRAVIDAQREELLRWRDAGHLPDASLRILERELDHEERTLPPHDNH